MATLTKEQLDFLYKHEVPLSRVGDATGMRTAEYQKCMKELDLWLAIGVRACKSAGHTLRTRAGHCAQCNTANLAFLRRYEDKGTVYVAQSHAIALTKVGAASDVAGGGLYLHC